MDVTEDGKATMVEGFNRDEATGLFVPFPLVADDRHRTIATVPQVQLEEEASNSPSI